MRTYEGAASLHKLRSIRMQDIYISNRKMLVVSKTLIFSLSSWNSLSYSKLQLKFNLKHVTTYICVDTC